MLLSRMVGIYRYCFLIFILIVVMFIEENVLSSFFKTHNMLNEDYIFTSDGFRKIQTPPQTKYQPIRRVQSAINVLKKYGGTKQKIVLKDETVIKTDVMQKVCFLFHFVTNLYFIYFK